MAIRAPDGANNLKTVKSSIYWHFWRNRLFLLTKNALLKRGPKNLGMGRPPSPLFRAMSERKRFFSIDPFPYSVLNLSQPTKSWAISTILEAAPCTTVGAKVLKCLSLCPATIGRMKNNWGNGDKPLCISYLSFHAREAAHPFAFYHFRPNSLTLIVFDLTLWHHGEAAPA